MSPGAPRSFDPPRPREVPITLSGRTLDGREGSVVLTSTTLIVAVKPGCDGCLPFVVGDLTELGDWPVVVLASASDTRGEWRDARREVLVAPDALEALGVRWPPFYLLVEPSGPRVVVEGVVFGPAQVAAELRAHGA